MKLKIATTSFVWTILICLILGSCKKFIQIPPAPNLITNTQVFSDSADANAAVIAMYVYMVGPNSTIFAPYNGGLTIYTGLSSDELFSTRGISEENAIYSNSLKATNSSIGKFWGTGAGSYSTIYKANAIIEGLANNQILTTAARNQLLGEAKLVRAFCYFNLVNLYGAVPLVTSTNYQANSVKPRTSIDSIYNTIISDLVSAQSLLRINYLTPGRMRPNQLAATALLARVYLYRQQWANAENAASQIINSGLYGLEPKLNNVFLASSNEAIWQMIPTQAGYETAEGVTFVPTSTSVKPKYVLSNYLMGAFENGDQRKVIGNWVKANTVSGQMYYYPFKYKLGHDNNTAPLENYMILRLAEQYLIRAEARTQLGSNLTGANADLNIIRNRAGLLNDTLSTQKGLLAAIYHERQVELFCEWGHRWLDLKRTGLADSVMGTGGICTAKGGSWQPNWQLYPINSTELQSNPFLNQNPGY